MTHYALRTVHGGWVTRPLCRLRTAVQPYITAILASMDAHASRMPPEAEAEVMRAIKKAAWR